MAVLRCSSPRRRGPGRTRLSFGDLSRRRSSPLAESGLLLPPRFGLPPVLVTDRAGSGATDQRGRPWLYAVGV